MTKHIKILKTKKKLLKKKIGRKDFQALPRFKKLKVIEGVANPNQGSSELDDLRERFRNQANYIQDVDKERAEAKRKFKFIINMILDFI